MSAFLPKLAVLGVVAGGFYATGDLPRLIDRGRRIAERSSVPLPAAGAPSSATVANPPPPAMAAARPTPQMPTVGKPAAAPPLERAAEEPTRIPMPSLALESVDLASLQPGQRVLLLCGRHVIALDVVDGPAGEVLEHAHACHADHTVTVASTAAPRRLVVIGRSPGSVHFTPGDDGRIALGEWLHVSPSSSIRAGRATSATEAIGPIEAVGLE